VLATAVHARAHGFEVEAVLVPQPRTDHVAEDLRAIVAQGARVFPARSLLLAPPLLAWRVASGARYLPSGGSSVIGAMGFVEAARELAAQVRRGELPEPDVVVVTLGSGGTAGGLAAGFELEKMRTRVVAVAIAPPTSLLVWRARALARRCTGRAGGTREEAGAAARRLILEARFRGPAYGHPTEAGDRATASWRAVVTDAPLDATYTAKAFAAALDLARTGEHPHLVYWHTLSSSPMAPLLERSLDEEHLPPPLRRLLLPPASTPRPT
jgi:D-cysteine desulfhydrase